MGSDSKKPIKVLLIRGFALNTNSASYNRNAAIEKMLHQIYDLEIITPSRKINYRSKLVSAALRRILFYWSFRKIYFYSRDKAFQHIVFLRCVKPISAFFVWCFSKPFGIKLAIERSEYPRTYIDDKPRLQRFLFKKLILSWHYSLFDVVFFMTDELLNFYKKHTKKNAIIQKLPMTVDFDRFAFNSKRNIVNTPYVFYAGSLSEKKDGVESLIKAFAQISQQIKTIQLLIAGETKDKATEKQLKIITKLLKLEKNVKFLGSVNRDSIPKLICGAEILVLPRPDSLQARGGFPTKLGEYLASGKPVIVTRVGDIPKELSGNEVFFISPNNIVNELSKTIEYILLNYDFALQVGQNGKTAAYSKFSLPSNQIHIKKAFDKALIQ